jgi:dTDP-glucose 4,6-dehydratase
LILASTSEIYGTPEVHPQPESYWGHVNSFGERSCYNESKRFAEALLYSYNKNFGLRHGLVRIFNTYGPRMDLSDGRVIIHSIRAIAQGEAVLVHGTGRQTRSFCYVSDLVEAIFRYTQSSLSEPINVGNPEEISIAHLIDSLYAFYPDQQKKITYDSISEEDPLMRRPDISKAQELLHWQPQVPLQEGLRLFKDWFEGKK